MAFLRRLALSTPVLAIIVVFLAPRWTKSIGYIWITLYVFLLRFFCVAVYHWLIYPHLLSPLRHLPQPSGASLFSGHSIEAITKTDGSYLRRWVETTPNDGLILFRGLFNVDQLLPTSPAALADILVHKCYDFEKPSRLKQGSAIAILGDGLLFAEGDVHKVLAGSCDFASWKADNSTQKQRKSLMPAFTFRHIKDLQPIFWKISVGMTYAMEAQTQTLDGFFVVEPNQWASRATLDIIGEAGLGRNFRAIDDPNNKLNRSYRNIFKTDWIAVAFGLLELVFPPVIINNLPVNRNRNLKENVTLVKSTCASLIKEKRQSFTERRSSPPSADILSAALYSPSFKFTDTELISQLTTFLVAGHETTAAALSWSIYVLCKYPVIQTTLRSELHSSILPEALEKSSPTLTTDLDIISLPYLSAFTSEVLRLYPPVPATVRAAAVPTSISGIPVPKGTPIILAPWAINTSTSLWGDDAVEFKPSRWLDSPSGGVSSNYANLTFLSGNRSCIGQSFARSELACLVAAFVGRFEIDLDEGQGEIRVDMMNGISAKPSERWRVRCRVVSRGNARI